jgi:hypothetical protein
MRWAYQIRRKFSVALLLAAIFAVMFAKNILNRHNVLELGASFSSVYEDRLVVESYIYRLSDHLFRKKIMIDTCKGTASAQRVKEVMEGHNASMAALLELYEKTNVTEKETSVFKHFKEEVAKISELEEVYLETVAGGYASSSAKVLIDSYFDEAVKNLDHLSGIQLSEASPKGEESWLIILVRELFPFHRSRASARTLFTSVCQTRCRRNEFSCGKLLLDYSYRGLRYRLPPAIQIEPFQGS